MFLAGAVFICLAVAPGLTSGFANHREHRLAYEAQQKLDHKEYRACRDLLQPYLDDHDHPAVTLFLLQAQAHTGLGQKQAALSTYARAATIYPSNALILRNYAVISQEMGRFSQAARLFEQSYAHGGSEELLYLAGAAWFEVQAYSRAARAVSRLINKTNKAKTNWVELLVYSLVRDKQWKQAERRVQSLIDRRTGDPELWQLLAHVRSQQGNILGAATALQLAYRLNEPGKMKWRDLAGMYAAAGVPLMAAKAMHKGLNQDPRSEDCWRLGRYYADALRIEKAVQWMDKALKQKDDPEWQMEKAHFLYAHGRYAQCREAALQAAGTGSEQGEAWMLAGYAAWQDQNWQKAKSAFVQAKKRPQTAVRASSCLQAVQQILDSEQKIRMVKMQNGDPGRENVSARG
jgi:tetratricopeptide (TPR) repeat protein